MGAKNGVIPSPPPPPLPSLHFSLFPISLGSVSSRCLGMRPCSPPERLSGGERGLIPEQRLDTESTISCAAKLSKSRSSVFLCSENPQKRLLRRLFPMQQLSALLQIQSGSDCPHGSLFKRGLISNTSQSYSATKGSHYLLLHPKYTNFVIRRYVFKNVHVFLDIKV